MVILFLIKLFINILDVFVSCFVGDDDCLDDDAPIVCNLTFDDGKKVRFIMRNGEELMSEFLRLKLMWHATFDRLELIPYSDKPFEYTITRRLGDNKDAN